MDVHILTPCYMLMLCLLYYYYLYFYSHLYSYCTNISFYLVLKAKRIPAHNHPVIERLLHYRNVSNLILPMI